VATSAGTVGAEEIVCKFVERMPPASRHLACPVNERLGPDKAKRAAIWGRCSVPMTERPPEKNRKRRIHVKSANQSVDNS